MYRITVEQHFDAAHALRGYKGKCENLHGHRFKVLASVETKLLNNIGLAFDFRDLKSALKQILDKYDHTSLNEVSPFDQLNPSSENLARSIYYELANKLQNVKLVSIAVWESPESVAEFFPD
ncbi:MAG: 6-carboxytetrahydropterin synthase QueD [Dehalococcoidia bacterium]|nr:6-carboxytetrahydropterin synthase QueD [Dehalococcoidia bacterium]